MITDRENTFSDKQAITATGLGTDVILVTSKMRAEPHKLIAQVETAFNNLTSLAVSFEASANSDMSSSRVIAASGAVALATLNGANGYRFEAMIGSLAVAEKYLGVRYTVVGTAPTLGKVYAGIVELTESLPAERPPYYTGR